ncbi:hypothetical protein MMPV_008824 [Pyropia vietnamensis]
MRLLIFVLHDADGGTVAGSASGAAADAAPLRELEATLRAIVTRLWADMPRPAALAGVILLAVFLVPVAELRHPGHQVLERHDTIADFRLRLHVADSTAGREYEAADTSHRPASSAATNSRTPSLLPRGCSTQLLSHAAAMMVMIAWRTVLEVDDGATAGAAQGEAAAAVAAALASVSTWMASAGAGVSSHGYSKWCEWTQTCEVVGEGMQRSDGELLNSTDPHYLRRQVTFYIDGGEEPLKDPQVGHACHHDPLPVRAAEMGDDRGGGRSEGDLW